MIIPAHVKIQGLKTSGVQAFADVKILRFADVVSSLRGHADNHDAIR